MNQPTDNRKEYGNIIVFALDQYKKDVGFYPSNLAELAPEYLESTPLVPGFSALPYQYQRTDSEYLLAFIDSIEKFDMGNRVCLYASHIKEWDCAPDNWGPFQVVPTVYPDMYPTPWQQKRVNSR